MRKYIAKRFCQIINKYSRKGKAQNLEAETTALYPKDDDDGEEEEDVEEETREPEKRQENVD